MLNYLFLKKKEKKIMEFFENRVLFWSKKSNFNIYFKKNYKFRGNPRKLVIRTCFFFTMNPVRCL